MHESARLPGKITSWKDDRGFGFITPADGGDDVFVHISAFAGRNRRPVGNEAVTYHVKTDARGRAQASGVWFADDRRRLSAASTRPVVTAIVFASLFLVAVTGLVVAGRLPPLLLAIYIGTSILAFMTYAWDKSAARNGRWRIPENQLHMLGIAGGWPGALVARQVFRHKSKKRAFTISFWTTLVLNSVALVWLLTPQGQRFLETIVSVT